MSLYNRTEKFVQESFLKSRGKKSIHAKRTVFWLLKIYPEADESMKIAAISHDIERAFRNDAIAPAKDNVNGFLDKAHIKYHQEKGVEIVSKFLLKNNADEKLIKKVKDLILKHEIGGTLEQNILKDADSISFFENNINHFINDLTNRIGKEKVKENLTGCLKGLPQMKQKKLRENGIMKG